MRLLQGSVTDPRRSNAITYKGTVAEHMQSSCLSVFALPKQRVKFQFTQRAPEWSLNVVNLFQRLSPFLPQMRPWSYTQVTIWSRVTLEQFIYPLRVHHVCWCCVLSVYDTESSRFHLKNMRASFWPHFVDADFVSKWALYLSHVVSLLLFNWAQFWERLILWSNCVQKRTTFFFSALFIVLYELSTEFFLCNFQKSSSKLYCFANWRNLILDLEYMPVFESRMCFWQIFW